MVSKWILIIFAVAIIEINADADNFSLEELLKQKDGTVERLNISREQALVDADKMMSSFRLDAAALTKQTVVGAFNLVSLRIAHFKEEIMRAKDNLKDNIIVDCFNEEGQLDVLEEQINNEIHNCITTIEAEIVNVISDSLNQAQMFMVIPEKIGKDVQQCGVSSKCLETIAWDAISLSLDVPPMVLTIAAKIQQLNLRTASSTSGCLLSGIGKVNEMGFNILQDVFYCIDDYLDGTQH